MRTRKLGALEVSELGFGILSFASTYGQAPDKAESIRMASLVPVNRIGKPEEIADTVVFGRRDHRRLPRRLWLSTPCFVA